MEAAADKKCAQCNKSITNPYERRAFTFIIDDHFHALCLKTWMRDHCFGDRPGDIQWAYEECDIFVDQWLDLFRDSKSWMFDALRKELQLGDAKKCLILIRIDSVETAIALTNKLFHLRDHYLVTPARKLTRCLALEGVKVVGATENGSPIEQLAILAHSSLIGGKTSRYCFSFSIQIKEGEKFCKDKTIEMEPYLHAGFENVTAKLQQHIDKDVFFQKLLAAAKTVSAGNKPDAEIYRWVKETAETDIKRPCETCGETKSKACAVCQRRRYCSQSCQKAHWKQTHKTECEILTAEGKLIRSILEGVAAFGITV